MGIPLMWRVDLDPVVVLHAFELQDGRYVKTAALQDVGTAPTLWGAARIDLRSLPTA